jgi:hypothetical protein
VTIQLLAPVSAQVPPSGAELNGTAANTLDAPKLEAV